MFIHYTTQYVILSIMQVPVVRFEFCWLKFYLEYAPNSFIQEAVCSTAGAMGNTLVFAINFTIAWGMKKAFDWYPKYYHNIICWMGIYAVLDPFITLFLDFAT